MTRAEFGRIAVVLDECWMGDFTETAEAAYFAVLGDKPAKVIEDALRALVDRGQAFRPTPPEIVRASNPNVDRTAFIEGQRAAFALRHGDKVANEFFGSVLAITKPGVAG